MRRLKLAAVAAGAFVTLMVAAPIPQSALAAPADQVQTGVNQIGGNEAESGDSLLSLIHKGVNVLLFVLGALAVVMIVFGGFKYVTSRGESAELTSAKNTILYAVIGLVVALLAYAVVDFVVGAFAQKDANATSSVSRPTA